MLINVKMPTIVGILTFMSRINFVLSLVEYEKSLITSRPVCTFPSMQEVGPQQIVGFFSVVLLFVPLVTDRMHCVVSLSKPLYPLLSTGSTQDDMTENC